MDHKTKPSETLQGVLWHTRPSIFLYAGTYVVCAVIIYFLIKLIYQITDQPYDLLVYYANWSRPITDWSTVDWPIFAVLGILIVIVILAIRILVKIAECLYTSYSISNEQLIIRRFIGLGMVEYRIEMYRIVDFMQIQMATGGLFGYATLQVRSTDANKPILKLVGVKNPKVAIDILRNETERCRQKKGIQEFVSPQMLHNTPPPGRR